MDPIPLEFKISEVTRVLQIAGELGGAVFGGYLRDVIIPRMSDPTWTAEWKDVDIWFKEQAQADQFVAQMGARLRRDHPGYRHDAGDIYEFDRTQYSLVHENRVLTFVDVIVAENLPVNDFDVNQIALIYLGDWFHHAGTTLQFLGPSIRAKEATLLPSYVRVLLRTPGRWQRRCHWYRLIVRYLKRGWTVYTPDGVALNPLVEERLDYSEPLCIIPELQATLEACLDQPQSPTSEVLAQEPPPSDPLLPSLAELSRQIAAIPDQVDRTNAIKRVCGQLMGLL